MPLGSSIGGKKQKAFKGSQHTSDAIWQKIDVVENICLLRIALKDLLQTNATDFKNLGVRQVGF